MADQTHKGLRNQTIYSVFVRNHTPEGTFQGVRRDLPRIRDLGADIVWLMPIHPIGEKARKGTLGSPYAIRDYRAVNPEFGTLEDFQQLVEDIHALGMKCIIDVVYNHTSPDSVLAGEHPEWFYHKADGSFGNRVGDWSDIIDLDYGQRALWDYQIETLKYWASMVDGFRCDVAPLVPLDFWKTARRQVEEVRPGCIWLAETVEPSFITFLRRAGYDCLSDSQAYEAFDICYDYDIYHTFRDCLEGKLPLEQYAQALNRQETTYPGTYVKLRCLENHDQLRAAFLLPDQGALLIYVGQEAGCTHLHSLFDRDPEDWSGPDRSELFRRLCAFKKNPLLTDSVFQVRALPHGVLYGTHFSGQRRLVGVFSTRGTQELVSVDVPDGIYTDLFSGGKVEVKHGKLSCQGRPVAVETAE